MYLLLWLEWLMNCKLFYTVVNTLINNCILLKQNHFFLDKSKKTKSRTSALPPIKSQGKRVAAAFLLYWSVFLERSCTLTSAQNMYYLRNCSFFIMWSYGATTLHNIAWANMQWNICFYAVYVESELKYM